MRSFMTLITTIASCTALSASFAWADLKILKQVETFVRLKFTLIFPTVGIMHI